MTVGRKTLVALKFLALVLLPHTSGHADFMPSEILVRPSEYLVREGSPARIFAFHGNTPEIVLDLGVRVPLAQPLLPIDCPALGQVCDSLQRGLFEEAVLELSARNEDGRARLALAELRIIMGQDREARRILDSLNAEKGQAPEREFLRGILQLRAGRPEEAVFRKLLDKAGVAASAWCALGHIRFLEGRYQEAFELYGEAERLEMKISFRYNKAAAHLLEGHLQEAGEILSRVLVQAPRFAESYLLLGFVEFYQSRPESALAAFLRAEELGADHPTLHYAIGTASQAAALHRIAAQYLEMVLKANPGNEQLRDQLVVSLMHAGEKEKAARFLVESPVLQGDDPQGHFLLGLKLLLCEQPRAASQVLFRSISLGKRDADTFFALGQALFLSEHVQEAQLALQIASKLAPWREDIRFMLALALAQNHQLEEAMEQLRRGDGEELTFLDSLGLRMELALQSGDTKGCIDDARRLLRIDPGLLEARFHLALCLAEAGELDGALRQLKIAIEADRDGRVTGRTVRLLYRLLAERTDVAGWYLLLAKIHHWRGDWSEAVLYLKKFILLAPTPGWSRLGANLLYELTAESR